VGGEGGRGIHMKSRLSAELSSSVLRIHRSCKASKVHRKKNNKERGGEGEKKRRGRKLN